MSRLHNLTDEELGVRLLERRTSALEAEVYERFSPLAEIHARRFCQQLFHRGANCKGHGAGRGACDGDYETAFAEIMRRIIGSEGRRPLRSLLSTWATERRHEDQTFGTFLSMALHADDILRAWCADRLLPTRGDRAPKQLLEDTLAAYRIFTASLPGDRPHLEHLDPNRPGLVGRWLDGLWRDAVQPGDGSLFDAVRLARWMIGPNPSPCQVAAVGQHAAWLDSFLSRQWPDWYDKYLDRGRQQTNPCDELAATATDDAGDADDEAA